MRQLSRDVKARIVLCSYLPNTEQGTIGLHHFGEMDEFLGTPGYKLFEKFWRKFWEHFDNGKKTMDTLFLSFLI